MIDVKIRDILQGEMPVLEENATLEEAAEAIRRWKKGAAAVVRNGRAVGILSERDVVRLLSGGADPETHVAPHLTRNVIAIREDRNVAHGLTLMAENGIRRLLVVDETGRAVGLVDQSTLVRSMEDDLFRAHLKAEQVLAGRRGLVTVRPHDTLRHAFKAMSDNNIGAVVVTQGERPVGILSESDALRAAAERIGMEKEVCSLMSTPVITVGKESFLVEIVRLMREKEVRRVVVTDEKGAPWSIMRLTVSLLKDAK